jgi:hypothetical protein
MLPAARHAVRSPLGGNNLDQRRKIMSTSTARKLVLGATAGVIALAAAAMPASAKGGHHRHHFRAFGPIVVTSGTVGCDTYYWKWKHTGARFWRSKYLACIG